jgi:signal transduction histidine kinase
LQTAVYRLAQEGLNNVAKHSRADKAKLAVTVSGDAVRLQVRDEGVGFEPTIVGKGFGLTGMHERVATLGGELEVVSSPGAGTEVRAQIPLPEQEPLYQPSSNGLAPTT